MIDVWQTVVVGFGAFGVMWVDGISGWGSEQNEFADRSVRAEKP